MLYILAFNLSKRNQPLHLVSNIQFRLNKALNAALIQNAGDIAQLVKQNFCNFSPISHNGLSMRHSATYYNKLIVSQSRK